MEELFLVFDDYVKKNFLCYFLYRKVFEKFFKIWITIDLKKFLVIQKKVLNGEFFKARS